jgi:hypothetical protein
MELSELIEQARQEKKWLKASSLFVDECFSPVELDEYNKKGLFRWGAKNWILVDPEILVKNITIQICNLIEEREQLLKRIEKCS